jgi:hypothetical protein
MMKHDTLAATPTHDRSQTFAAPGAPPVAIFYVVRSADPAGERVHHLCSQLFETRPQADTELARVRREDRNGGIYSVWKSATYVDLAEWLHRVVRLDGTLILPRLHDTETLADA